VASVPVDLTTRPTDQTDPAAWVIVGCGYVGRELATRLVSDHADVIVTRRDATAAQASARALGVAVRGVAVDLARPAGGGVPAGSIVVVCAPPGPDPAAEIAALVAFVRGCRRLVYVSSTSVYAPGGGAWVDEAWPTVPTTAAGRARVVAERALAAADVSTIVLRVAGIYGPGRGLVERLRAGSYRVIGDGSTHVSRIHVADLVEAIVRAGTSEIGDAVNVADDDPAPIGLVADAVAARLGVAAPPRVAASAVDPEIAGMLTADRRIANRRMKLELGVVLRYPSWRDAA
jgi:nucleoside-diphosphate-sugar epimerase